MHLEPALRDTPSSPSADLPPDNLATIVVLDAIRNARPAVNEPPPCTPRAPRYHGDHAAFAWLLAEATVFDAHDEH